MREPLSIAYLLARIADTITDTRIIEPEKRIQLLCSFREQLSSQTSLSSLQNLIKPLVEKKRHSTEQQLLMALTPIATAYAALPKRDRQQVEAVLFTLIKGMEMDLKIFPLTENGTIQALKTDQQLDDYVYSVAGCVGEFWTKMIMTHEKAVWHWDKTAYIQLGIRFGKALQLTNVLRDIPHDIRMGRCYLPLSQFEKLKIHPENLLQPDAVAVVKPIIVHWLKITLSHYEAAEQYYLSIPRHCWRLRLACVWPMLIGLATLGKMVNQSNWLDIERPVKVNRAWIYRMILISIPSHFSNLLMRLWIKRLRTQVINSL